jgi:hypothetical protein
VDDLVMVNSCRRARALPVSDHHAHRDSPVTGESERVTLVTREAGDGHVLYLLLIGPGGLYDELRDAFERMVSSLEVNDRAAHPPSE